MNVPCALENVYTFGWSVLQVSVRFSWFSVLSRLLPC